MGRKKWVGTTVPNVATTDGCPNQKKKEGSGRERKGSRIRKEEDGEGGTTKR